MLISLILAASLFSQSPVPAVQAHNSSPSATLHFNLAAPASQTSASMQPPRPLLPLKATLTLDEQTEDAREANDLTLAINRERVSRGLEPLTLDPLLCEAALAHCREMCRLNYFAHRSPTPGETSPTDRYLDELPVFGEKRPAKAMIGENIFYVSMTTPEYNAAYAHRCLMASPDHRENILQPRFTKVGVGLYRDSQGEFWVTEMFLRDS